MLTVRDVARTVDFYVNVLGMKPEHFGGDRVAVKFGHQKLNLHQLGHEFEPRASISTPGSADLCFLTETPLTLVKARFKERNVYIVEGPVERTGANGRLLSMYIRDPDGNLVEIANSIEPP